MLCGRFVWGHFKFVTGVENQCSLCSSIFNDPWAIISAYIDEFMMKVLISALIFCFVKRVSTMHSETIDVQIIDAAFFCHFSSELPQPFEGVAKVLLKKILQCDRQIFHFVSVKLILFQVSRFILFQVSRRHQLKTAKEIPGKHQAALLSTLEQLVANRPIYHSVFELWEATILRLLFWFSWFISGRIVSLQACLKQKLFNQMWETLATLLCRF